MSLRHNVCDRCSVICGDLKLITISMTALVAGRPFAVDGSNPLEPWSGNLAKLIRSSLRHFWMKLVGRDRLMPGFPVVSAAGLSSAGTLSAGLSAAGAFVAGGAFASVGFLEAGALLPGYVTEASRVPDSGSLADGADATGEPVGVPAGEDITAITSERAISGPAAAELALDRIDIAGTLQGDQEAFARLMARYQSLVAGTMWRFTHDRTIYEELVHNVFVETYLSLSKFRGECPFSFWLRKIAVRVGYYHWKIQTRRRARGLVSLEEVGDLTAEEAPPRPFSDDAERVFGLLERLPPRDRLVLTLMYVEGRSVAESAELAGWSQAMVKMQAFRARKKLEKLLRKSDT